MKRFVAVVALLLGSLSVAAPSPAVAAPRRTPSLVVILVVDQMRADYVEKFGQNWTGGFRRLMDEGAWFREASYPYMTTVTCVGHSTIATGALPYAHGIVSNQWLDRESGRPMACVSDPDATLVSYGTPATKGGTSTRNLRVPTLSDELRVQTTVPPRIVTMSMKDYTATTLAGRRADAAVWVNDAARSLMTSSSFTSAPVPFVAAFAKAHPIDADFGRTWSRLLPESAYLYDDNAQGERPPARWTNTFPHVLKGASDTPDTEFYDLWEESPYSDAYLGQLAEAAVDALKLGQGRGIDYLAVSFSALDVVGHDFGPRSHEVQDILAHLDRTLESLIEHLDRSVGRDRYVLALTADHGVAPIPEQAAALGLTAGRISNADLVARVEKAMEPALGPGRHVARMLSNDLYFEPGVFEKLKANPDAMRAVLDAVRSTPGVARVFRADELAQPSAAADDAIERAVLAGFFPARSGDLIVIPRQYWLYKSGTSDRVSGTSHGTPYGYDQHVPMFFLGQGIRSGQYLAASAPVDIAPTLAFLCGVTLSSTDGRVLNEALLPLPAPGETGVK